MTLTISNKGRLVIPAELRRKYGLRPGSHVCIVDYGGVLTLVPALDNPIEQAAGLLRGTASLTHALLVEHHTERAGGR